MEPTGRIEGALEMALARFASPDCPTGLKEAARWAVFPGGGRVRARLCLAVARACGDDAPALADAAAAAIELIHCASLVHDDLPCFDDAPIRRGRPSVHSRFGEQRAVLVGDGLIVQAFDELGRSGAALPHRLAGLVTVVAAGAGAVRGIVAGQAWESEPTIDLEQYHRTKSAALIEAATEAGAIAAGAASPAWARPGQLLGLAYQTADDIADAAGDPVLLGKPAGQDQAHQRPNAVTAWGLDGALDRLDRLVAEASAAVPACPGRPDLLSLLDELAHRLCPPELRARLLDAAGS